MGLPEIVDAWQSKKVLVLGDAMIDRWVYGHIPRQSPESDCPIFVPDRTEEYPGGAANVCANIHAMGGIGQLVAPREKSTKTRFVTTSPYYRHLMRFDEDATPADVGPTTVERLLTAFAGAIRHNDIVLLSDYAKGALRDEVLLPAIRIARDQGKLIVVDPKRAKWAAYAGCNYMTPNEREWLAAQDGEPTGPDLVAVVATMGVRGSVVYDTSSMNDKDVRLHAHRVNGVECAGAGDTFVAAFTLGIAAGATAVDAARIANVAAAIAVSKPATATVTLKELKAAL